MIHVDQFLWTTEFWLWLCFISWWCCVL